MVRLPYRVLVELASNVGDLEPSETIDHFNSLDATIAFERVRPWLDAVRGMELSKCTVPIELHGDFFQQHMQDLQYLRSLSRALGLAAEFAAFNEDYDELADYGATLLDLANAIRRGGLVVDHLVSLAVSDCGVNCLRRARMRYSDSTRRKLIHTLSRYDREREPLSHIVERDARWEAESGYTDADVVNGEDLLASETAGADDDQHSIFRDILEFSQLPKLKIQSLQDHIERMSQATTRLLIIDLALRCWQRHSGQFPNVLSRLAPEYLSFLPRDPFTGSEFIYRPSTNTFALYSTGPEKIDHNGQFGTRTAVLEGGCDLCLDADDY